MNLPTHALDVPIFDEDPFDLAFLNDPYPYYKTLRALGPVVWIPKYEIYACGRFAEVNSILRDWETFSSAAGGGLANFNKEKPWRKPSIILEADPPKHTQTRKVLDKVLNRSALKVLREGFEQKARELIDQLLMKREIDGVCELAQVFPLGVFPDVIGLCKEGRENLLPYANMAFNAFGPRNALFEESFKEAQVVIDWITAQCKREALSPGGLGQKIFDLAEANGLTQEEGGMLVRSLLTAGLDTTIYGIANTLLSFASYPEQWDVLKADHKLFTKAFTEVIRFQSPVQTFFRTTTKAVDVSGYEIPAEQKVLLFLASANRDGDKWERPDEFDITRNAGVQVGFGSGIHVCVGQMLARLEAEVVFLELLKRVKSIELAGDPVRRYNNTLRGLEHLPLILHPE
jgi:cytochrome P450